MEMKDYIEAYHKPTTRVIYTCCLRLDKKTILEMLKGDFISLDGELFRTPERKLIECLANREFGPTTLELEKVKAPSEKP